MSSSYCSYCLEAVIDPHICPKKKEKPVINLNYFIHEMNAIHEMVEHKHGKCDYESYDDLRELIDRLIIYCNCLIEAGSEFFLNKNSYEEAKKIVQRKAAIFYMEDLK